MSKRATSTLVRIRNTVAEMNYAQRRVVETKLGIPPEGPRYHGTGRHEIDELEALFALEPSVAEGEIQPDSA